jgi:hypothetical protein
VEAQTGAVQQSRHESRHALQTGQEAAHLVRLKHDGQSVWHAGRVYVELRDRVGSRGAAGAALRVHRRTPFEQEQS